MQACSGGGMKGACVSSGVDAGEGGEKVMMKLCSEDLAYRDVAAE